MKKKDFVIRNYTELHHKVLWEFQRFTFSSDQREQDYLFFNILLSLNHLFDWVINDLSIPLDIRLECVRRFNPYDEKSVEDIKTGNSKSQRNLRDAFGRVVGLIPRNWKQEIVREFANHEKHLAIPKGILGFHPAGEKMRSYYIERDMETEAEKETTRKALGKTWGDDPPWFVKKWLKTPKAVLTQEFVSEILRPLVDDWQSFLQWSEPLLKKGSKSTG